MSKLFRVAAMLAASALLFVPPAKSAAQAENEPGWPNYINCQAGFAVIFPRAPQTRNFTYRTRTGANLPGQQYYLEQGGNLMQVSVVQFAGGPIIDEQEMDFAANTMAMRGEVRFREAGIYDPGFPGRQLNIFLPNDRQLRGSVYMMERRLFIIEALGPVSDFEALQFEQSISLITPEGVDYDQNPGDPLRQFPCRNPPFRAS
jgi:hypothetical protein